LGGGGRRIASLKQTRGYIVRNATLYQKTNKSWVPVDT
jgi:hypothetical protein